MINTLITSKTRIKLLFKFFLGNNSISYLRNLEQEFGESTNAIRLELNRFEKSGLLLSWNESNRKMYKANPDHPMYSILQKIVYKELNIYPVVNIEVLTSLGISRLYIVGDFNDGITNYIKKLIFVSQNPKRNGEDKELVQELMLQENNFKYEIVTREEFIIFNSKLTSGKPVLIWKTE